MPAADPVAVIGMGRVKAGQLGGGRTKLRGTIDVITLQTLGPRNDIAELTAGYGLIAADECHHVPATGFEQAVKQIPATPATPTRPLLAVSTPTSRPSAEPSA